MALLKFCFWLLFYASAFFNSLMHLLAVYVLGGRRAARQVKAPPEVLLDVNRAANWVSCLEPSSIYERNDYTLTVSFQKGSEGMLLPWAVTVEGSIMRSGGLANWMKGMVMCRNEAERSAPLAQGSGKLQGEEKQDQMPGSAFTLDGCKKNSLKPVVQPCGVVWAAGGAGTVSVAFLATGIHIIYCNSYGSHVSGLRMTNVQGKGAACIRTV